MTEWFLAACWGFGSRAGLSSFLKSISFRKVTIELPLVLSSTGSVIPASTFGVRTALFRTPMSFQNIPSGTSSCHRVNLTFQMPGRSWAAAIPRYLEHQNPEEPGDPINPGCTSTDGEHRTRKSIIISLMPCNSLGDRGLPRRGRIEAVCSGFTYVITCDLHKQCRPGIMIPRTD